MLLVARNMLLVRATYCRATRGVRLSIAFEHAFEHMEDLLNTDFKYV